MKLVVAIIQDRDIDRVLRALTEQHIGVTRVATSGGFLEQGNSTLLIGVDEARVTIVVEALRLACRRRNMFVPMAVGITDPAYGMHNQIEIEVGGATIFTFDVEHFEQM
jgi:uncharacterized protein YaaQ